MNNLKDSLSGVNGAICCVYSGLPFEVVKVRLQTQTNSNRYNGVLHGFKRIATEEGVRALWKGAIPALSSSIIENSVLFTANGIIRRSVIALYQKRQHALGISDENIDIKISVRDEALMGGLAGFFSGTAITPAEVVKCKLQFQRGRLGEGEFSGPLSCARKILATEGLPGLFRGWTSVLLRDIPFNFIFFGAYDAYTSMLVSALDKQSKDDLHPALILSAGGMAGATGWSIVFPADVIKSHMQTASITSTVSSTTLKNQRTLGFRGAAQLVYSNHGIRGFYRGWSAAIMRAFPANGSLFLGVEMTHRVIRYFESDE